MNYSFLAEASASFTELSVTDNPIIEHLFEGHDLVNDGRDQLLMFGCQLTCFKYDSASRRTSFLHYAHPPFHVPSLFFFLCHAVHSISDIRRRIGNACVMWVAFSGQFWPLTSLTPGGRNRIQFQHRPHGEFCLPTIAVGT